MPDKPLRIGCVLMASGASRRFGDDNKLLVPFHGSPLVTHAFRGLHECCDRAIVVTRWPEVARLAQDAGLEVLLHTLPEPSDTIRLGLDALRDMDGCAFRAADQPLLSLDTLRALVNAFCAQPNCIVRPTFAGEVGNPVVFPASLFEELLHLPAGRSGGWVIARHPERVRTVEARSALELVDIDTPDALHELSRLS